MQHQCPQTRQLIRQRAVTPVWRMRVGDEASVCAVSLTLVSGFLFIFLLFIMFSCKQLSLANLLTVMLAVRHLLTANVSLR